MKKVISAIVLSFLINGCAAASNETIKTEINIHESLAGINSALPKIIDDTKIVSVFKTYYQDKPVFMCSYVLLNAEKDLLNFRDYGHYIYNTKCSDKLISNDIIFKYSYYDKSYVFIGEFYFSKNICTAMKHVISNDKENFKKYLYSLFDDEFMALKLNVNDLLSEEFKEIYSNRFGDLVIH